VNPGADARGGAERSLLGLIDGLDRAATVASAVVLGEGSMVGALRERGVAATSVRLGFRTGASHEGVGRRLVTAGAALSSMLKAAAAVREAIERTGAEVVHTNGMRGHVLLPLIRRQHVATIASIRELPRSRSEALVLRAALRSADAVIANSEHVKRRLHYAKTIEVVDNPVSVPALPDRLAARGAMGIPQDVFVVALLAHFHPAKGHLDLLRAVEPLRHVWVILAGGDIYGTVSTDHRAEVLRFARRRGFAHRVRCLGGVDDVGPVYAAADMVAHCSVMRETFGRTLVEGMLAGKPVLASSSGAPGEFITSGRNGLLYPPGNVAELRARIRCLAASAPLRESLARAATEDLANRFAPELHAARLQGVYAKLIASDEARRP
jgi:glycosyltransferase involved in cell wall biosynthesis